MKKRLAGLMIAAMMFACIPHAFANSEFISVTKETQAKLGLKFTLSAVRVSETAVLVRMEIPKEGKLKDLKRVTMTIGTGTIGTAGSPLVSATLQTTPGKKNSWVVSFQLSPDLADKCSIDLVVLNPAAALPNESFYAVELKGYVTDRK